MATTGIADQGGYQRGRNPADSPIAPVHAAAPGLAEGTCAAGCSRPGTPRHFETPTTGRMGNQVEATAAGCEDSAVFRFYLERQLPDGRGAGARPVEDALSHLTSSDELRQYLGPWSPGELLSPEPDDPAIEELPGNDDAIRRGSVPIAFPSCSACSQAPRRPACSAGMGRCSHEDCAGPRARHPDESTRRRPSSASVLTTPA